MKNDRAREIVMTQDLAGEDCRGEDCRERIAVVDDDPAVLDSLKFLLELSGREVVPYESAAAFLADRGLDWRCLIVDQHMPQMTGLDLVEYLREAGQMTPVLLMTGAYSAAIGARAAAIGVGVVVEKPLCNDQVEAFLAVCVASRDEPAPPPVQRPGRRG